MMILLFASGCTGGSPGEKTRQVRETYTGAEGFVMTAKVTADYGERVYEYTLRYTYVKDGDGQIEVLEPELIAGIQAVVREDGLELIYDGASLETGRLSGDGLTPMDALPAMVRAWKEWAATEEGAETLGKTKTLRITFETESSDGDPIVHSAWFDEESYIPLQAETSVEDFTVIRCEVTEFEFT
ncbi:hypothetical protein [Papillibacter cinnamivorans]|uniref:Outer membrane lipoprotein-sorting protein n=1 Tax=Papillibacter cinnamivorans DSM 12816 TaxID=1122930 RepID=A0A1W1ZBD1_9FIRM|nr:hypothetical protein [Papillibacter cinnamivorans]SMC45582.1 Outer membrane lipoprotein-sorting protein [Papillibacter cinnamivorans DSM 12816]